MIWLLAVAAVAALAACGDGEDGDSNSGGLLPPKPDANGDVDSAFDSIWGDVADANAGDVGPSNDIPYDPDMVDDLTKDIQSKDDNGSSGDIPPNEDVAKSDDGFVVFDSFVEDNGSLDMGFVDPGTVDSGQKDLGVDPGQKDLGVDPGQDPGPTTPDVPPQKQSWECKFVATDKNSMKYAMLTESNDVTVNASGWSGKFNFAAAPGTEQLLVTQRLSEPASVWNENAEPYAQSLVAKYDIDMAVSTGAANMVIRNYNDQGQVSDAFMAPMTWYDNNSDYNDPDPEPISGDGSNEIYVSKQDAFLIGGNCESDDCTAIEGIVSYQAGNFPDGVVPDYLSALKFTCNIK